MDSSHDMELSYFVAITKKKKSFFIFLGYSQKNS